MSGSKAYLTPMSLGTATLLLLGLLLRLYNLDHWPIWIDEALSMNIVYADFGDLYKNLFPQDLPLHFIVSRGFVELGFGGSELLLRLPNVSIGVATIWATIGLGRALMNWQAGLLGGILVALNPVMIQMSQEYRMYSLFYFLIVVMIWSAWLVYDGPEDKKNVYLNVFVGASIACIYTQFGGILAVVSTGAALAVLEFYTVRHISHIWHKVQTYIGHVFVLIIACLPFIPFFLRLQNVESDAGRMATDATKIFEFPALFFFEKIQFPQYLAVAIAIIAAIGLIAFFRNDWRKGLFLVIIFSAPAFLLSLNGWNRVSANARYTYFLLPIYSVTFGHGLYVVAAFLTSKFIKAKTALQTGLSPKASLVSFVLATIVILPFTAMSYESNFKTIKTDYRPIFEFLEERLKDDDAVWQIYAQQRGSRGFHRHLNKAYTILYDVPIKNLYNDDLKTARQNGKNFINQEGALFVMIETSDAESLQKFRDMSEFSKEVCGVDVCLYSFTQTGTLGQKLLNSVDIVEKTGLPGNRWK